DGADGRVEIRNRHARDVAHHFLRRGAHGATRILQADPIQRRSTRRIVADVPVDGSQLGDLGIRRKRVVGAVAGTGVVGITEVAGTIAGRGVVVAGVVADRDVAAVVAGN